ncbi:MAG: alpha-hydroxy-acid oxidizing protein [Acidovorax sp.]|nr:alpha-hydroxy-acid oxidizing protein [Acidovorax sp.]
MNALGQAIQPARTQIAADTQSLADYAQQAIHHVEAHAWCHIEGGSDQNLTLQHNRAAFDALRLLPRHLADLRHAHTRSTLLGHALESPILLAPVAYHRLVHPEGELATMRAAMALQTGMVVSTLSSHTLEEIAAAGQQATQDMGHGGGPRWFQLYFQPQREHTLALLRRAEAAGYTAIVWTVDASIKRSGFPLPYGVEAANLRGMPAPQHTSHLAQGPILFGTPLALQAPSWDDLTWLRAQTRLPLLVKGVLSPATARQAVAGGADALIVSNHGGRVLDGAVSPLEVLPAIADAVNVPLLLDSGVRWGSDVFKALALGAQAVLVGRPQLHALATAGMLGVAHMLHLLRAELELCMAQMGCATLADIGPDCLWQSPASRPPHKL